VLAVAAIVLVMALANVATNLLPSRWTVPICVVAAAVLLALGLAADLSAADLGFGAGTLLAGLGWAALLVLGVAVTYAVAGAVPRTRVAFADRRVTEAGGRTVAWRALVSIPFGTVLLEEVAFRSVLFGAVLVRFGAGWAVVVTSVLFGLWHVAPATAMHQAHDAVGAAFGSGRRAGLLAVLATVAFTTGAGLVFAGLRLWTGSVLPPIGLHWAVNGLGVAVAWWLAYRRLIGDRAGDAS
jgi:membrane protease YdiL (CAAX protease family)